MSRTFVYVWISALLMLSTAFSSVEAQGSPSDTSIARIAATVRAGHGALAIKVLAQKSVALSSDRLDAIADTLVQIAVAYRRGDPPEIRRAASAAVTAIANAGVSSRNEHPYPRAFEKLARIYELSDPSLGQRAGTLWLMTQLPVPDRVLPFLRQVAVSQDRVAYRAVQLLAREMGPAGLGIARELYENALVTEPEAAKILNQIAEYHGWGGRADLDVEGWIPPPGPPTPR